MLVRGILCAVSVLVTFAFTVPPAAGYTPVEGATFNRPVGSKSEKFRLVRQVRTTIQSTPKGATILIATYLLDQNSVVDALVAADRRGVNVQVVMDERIDTVASRRLIRALGSSPQAAGRNGPRSFAVVCQRSCRYRGGDMHAKFFAFSRAGKARNVVMVGSTNLNAGGATLGWNDLFTSVGKPQLFQAFQRIHAQMARDKPLANPWRIFRVGRFTVQFFPRLGSSRRIDPVYTLLSRVRCRGATGGTGRGGRTAINVSVFWWSGQRGMYLARKLIGLDRAGCDVRVIYGAPSKQVAAVLQRSAKAGGIRLYDSRYDRNGDGFVDLRVHSKYLLINGVYGGDTSLRRTFTGSANWSDGSLRTGDEVTLGILGRGAYARYLGNWRDVRRTATRTVGGDPARSPHTMSGAETRASSASRSVRVRWLSRSASTRRR